MHLMKNFQKGETMGEVLKFVTLDGVSEKKTQKSFCIFCKNNSILRPFWVKLRFKKPVLNSSKRAQNRHKKNWRAQLIDVFSNDDFLMMMIFLMIISNC